jgi:hypothetical protein
VIVGIWLRLKRVLATPFSRGIIYALLASLPDEGPLTIHWDQQVSCVPLPAGTVGAKRERQGEHPALDVPRDRWPLAVPVDRQPDRTTLPPEIGGLACRSREKDLPEQVEMHFHRMIRTEGAGKVKRHLGKWKVWADFSEGNQLLFHPAVR